MQPLRHRINPQTFAITLKQLAKHLKINQERILNWEKWHNVLWVHIEGLGGYFISYRKLEQWIAACRTLIRFCPNLEALNTLWSLILQEAQRYTPRSLLPTRSYVAATTNLSVRSPLTPPFHAIANRLRNAFIIWVAMMKLRSDRTKRRQVVTAGAKSEE